jgi:hypothetical protein
MSRIGLASAITVRAMKHGRKLEKTRAALVLVTNYFLALQTIYKSLII